MENAESLATRYVAESLLRGVFISSGPAFLTILGESLAEKGDKKQAEKERCF